MPNIMWRMRDGTEIAVDDMEDSHVTNVLKMLSSKYMVFCLTNGAMHAHNLRLDHMPIDEQRTMLKKTCDDRTYLKNIVARQCFGELRWAQLKEQFDVDL